MTSWCPAIHQDYIWYTAIRIKFYVIKIRRENITCHSQWDMLESMLSIFMVQSLASDVTQRFFFLFYNTTINIPLDKLEISSEERQDKWLRGALTFRSSQLITLVWGKKKRLLKIIGSQKWCMSASVYTRTHTTSSHHFSSQMFTMAPHLKIVVSQLHFWPVTSKSVQFWNMKEENTEQN